MQCETQVVELEDLNGSEGNGDDTRMSVSIQVTHSLDKSGKSTRRQIRISKQDLRNVTKTVSVSPEMERFGRDIGSGDQMIESALAHNSESNLKEENESDDASQVEQPMSPRSQDGEDTDPKKCRKEKEERGASARTGTVTLESVIKASQSTGAHVLQGSYDAQGVLTQEFAQVIPPPLVGDGEFPLNMTSSAMVPLSLLAAASPVGAGDLTRSTLLIENMLSFQETLRPT